MGFPTRPFFVGFINSAVHKVAPENSSKAYTEHAANNLRSACLITRKKAR